MGRSKLMRKRVSLLLDDDQVGRLESRAKRDGVSVQDLIMDRLHDILDDARGLFYIPIALTRADHTRAVERWGDGLANVLDELVGLAVADRLKRAD